MGLLWVEFFAGFTVRRMDVFSLSPFLLLLFGFIGTATTVSWLVLKRMLVSTRMAFSLQTYVNRVKKDTELFKAFLSNQKEIPEFRSFPEIVLGNVTADNVLIAVITPNCPSCAALYRSIQRFLKSNSDALKVILRFKPGERDNGWDRQVIEYVLSFNINNMKEKALSVLEEWYNMEYREINVWKKKCNLTDTTVSEEAKLMREAYGNWLLSVDISGAPAMILNNKPAPVYYTFDDVKYFLKRM